MDKTFFWTVLGMIGLVVLLLVLSSCSTYYVNRDLTNSEWSSISEYIKENGPLKQEDIQVD